MPRRKTTDPAPRWTVRATVRMAPEDRDAILAARLPGETFAAAVRRLALEGAGRKA